MQGLALPGDFERLDSGELKFVEEGTVSIVTGEQNYFLLTTSAA